jgi:ribosome-binding protein aMBF1 (putative translation factor)
MRAVQMYEHMSIYHRILEPASPTRFRQQRRRFWGQVFGVGIGNIRKHTGLSVEDAAELAGMEASEWAAIEAGCVPRSTARLKMMARALDVSLEELANLVQLCSEAWTL